MHLTVLTEVPSEASNSFTDDAAKDSDKNVKKAWKKYHSSFWHQKEIRLFNINDLLGRGAQVWGFHVTNICARPDRTSFPHPDLKVPIMCRAKLL